MERCPACLARMGENPVCRRCGCDLTLALAAERRARRYLSQALEALQTGGTETARELVQRALGLDSSKALRIAAAFVLRQGAGRSEQSGPVQTEAVKSANQG